MSEIRTDEREDLWGYGKRLRFVRTTIVNSFPAIANSEIRVLDVGCGNGSQLALPLVSDSLQVFGIDTDPHSISHAKSLASGASNAHFQCRSIEDISKEKPFHVVILSEVLEHVPDPKTLLAASLERMRREGVMIVTVPNGYGGFEIDSWLFRNLRLQRLVDAVTRTNNQILGATDNTDMGHIQFFTRKRLSRLFDECGLKIARQGVGPLLAGPIAGHTLARSHSFIHWNAQVTERLPFACASGWYFALQRKLSSEPSGVGV